MELSNSQSAILAKQPSQDNPFTIYPKDTLGEDNSLNLSKPMKSKSDTQEPTYRDPHVPSIKITHLTDKDQKIKEIKEDLAQIESVIFKCEDVERREMLLDRGLVLSGLLNRLIKSYGGDTGKENELYKTKGCVGSTVNEVQINPELLDKRYWTMKKVDRFEKTAERRKVPQEFWYNVKGKKFSRELHKCYALAMGDFKRDYNWLFGKK